MRRTVPANGAVRPGPGPGAGNLSTPTAPVGPRAASGWTPTVANLMVLLIMEIIIFALVRMVIRKVVK